MRFRQLDRIVDLKPGMEITAARTLSDREYYFKDHFPQFPVLPGVLSLESMFQACDWLVRKTDEFACSVLLLKEVRNAKFADLVRPGQTITVSAKIKSLDRQVGKLAAQVAVEDKVVASARLVVERFNLADRLPARDATDRFIRKHKREQFKVLDPQSDEHHSVSPTNFRWMWLDRFTEFVRGHRAAAIKTVSLTDEPIDMYMPGYPIMPCSLIIEGLAQTGGILVNESLDFGKQLVLAKVSKATFHRPAIPGDTMTFATEIMDATPDGFMVRGSSEIDGEPHVDAELVFANVKHLLGGVELMNPADALGMLRLYGLYDVGETATGDRLSVPGRLLEAENKVFADAGVE